MTMNNDDDDDEKTPKRAFCHSQGLWSSSHYLPSDRATSHCSRLASIRHFLKLVTYPSTLLGILSSPKENMKPFLECKDSGFKLQDSRCVLNESEARTMGFFDSQIQRTSFEGGRLTRRARTSFASGENLQLPDRSGEPLS